MSRLKKLALSFRNAVHPIYFSKGNSGELGTALKKHFKAARWVLLTHPEIDALHGERIAAEFQGLGKLEKIFIPAGESFKTLETVGKIYESLAKLKIDRQTPLVALGGGVVGDIVGFAAATYLRGLPLVQIPTTLLAQVDSSVGGKTGVDLLYGKNLVGAFYQPHLVWIDFSMLQTLPEREILCGSAEIIKYAAIRDPKLFTLLEKNTEALIELDPELLEKVIVRCVKIKADVVSKDEYERSGLRMILNFGHTLGHAIETLSHYERYSHGEAVALGMIFAARLSLFLKICKKETVVRLQNLIEKMGFDLQIPPFKTSDYLLAMQLDKKMLADQIQFVLLEKIGATSIRKLDFQVIQAVLDRGV